MNENITLNFRGMIQSQYRLSIFFIILSIFLIPTIFMTIVISYQLNKIPRAVGIMIMGISAIIVFFIISFLFKSFSPVILGFILKINRLLSHLKILIVQYFMKILKNWK